MANSSVSHKIKNRKTSNDVFYTPEPLALKHISIVEKLYAPQDFFYLDPFKGKGIYFDNFKSNNKDWREISEGKDFFTYQYCDDKPLVIVSNPPYSIINNIIDKIIELNPVCFSFLIALHNLTTKRLETLQKYGYEITYLEMLKVHNWYGMSCIVVFEKNNKPVIHFDRTIYKLN